MVMLPVLVVAAATALLRAPSELGLKTVRREGKAAPLTNRWSASSKESPSPTNAWWENLVLCDPSGDPIAGLGLEVNCNVFVVPYVVWPSANLLNFAAPYRQDQGFNAANMFDDTSSVRVSLGAVAHTRHSSNGAERGWHENGYDDLTVRLAWPSAGIESALARGSPYVSVEYTGDDAMPLFESPQYAESITAADGFDAPSSSSCDADACDGASLTGTKFVIHLAQSDETWVLYASSAITLTCTNSKGPTPGVLFGGSMRFEASSAWRGVLRAALLTNCSSGSSLAHCAPGTANGHTRDEMGAILDAHAATYPVGGVASSRVSRDAEAASGQQAAEPGSASGRVTVTYEWTTRDIRRPVEETRAAERKAAGMPLVLMPHHVPLLATSAATLSGVSFPSVHGTCRLALLEHALSWRFELPLVATPFHAPRAVPDAARPTLLSELATEAKWQVPPNYQSGAGDPYNAGKLLARLGRTALIAEALGQQALAAALAANLTTLVSRYAIHGPENEWIYDETWGGLIACGCDYDDCKGTCLGHCTNSFPTCPSLADPGRDFGNGYYNDHHFHWGYHLYAASVAAKLGPASVPWTAAGAKRLARAGGASDHEAAEAASQRARLLLLARDIAAPTHDDPAFPRTRHKDWFQFVSWASGIATAGNSPYRNGRNQESSSEAINAYYGLSLLGTALGEHEWRDIGQALLSMEVIATKTYYHPRKHDGIHSDAMVANGMVGMLWQNLAQYQTWFGPASYLVHGIQVLPVTPVTESVLDESFVGAGQLNVFAASCDATPACATDGWAAFVALDRAIVDPKGAWEQVQALADEGFAADSPAGNGNSRLNSLYWVATRPHAAEALTAKTTAPATARATARGAEASDGSFVGLFAAGSGQRAGRDGRTGEGQRTGVGQRAGEGALDSGVPSTRESSRAAHGMLAVVGVLIGSLLLVAAATRGRHHALGRVTGVARVQAAGEAYEEAATARDEDGRGSATQYERLET